MRIDTVFALVTASLIHAASAKCMIGAAECEWEGTSTECGTTNAHIGDWNEHGQQLSFWTRRINIDSLYAKFKNQMGWNCYNDYGLHCVGGYKRLWCREPLPNDPGFCQFTPLLPVPERLLTYEGDENGPRYQTESHFPPPLSSVALCSEQKEDQADDELDQHAEREGEGEVQSCLVQNRIVDKVESEGPPKERL